MADITVNGLTAYTALAVGDFIGVWDIAAAAYKKSTRAQLVGATITGGGTIATGGFTLTVPATGTAALVSEGTWTPDLQFGGANTGITYTGRQGSYIRIGNLCFVAGSLTLSNKGSATGNATLTGLPFTVRNTSGLVHLLQVRWYGMTGTLVAAGGDFSPGTTIVNLLGNTTSGVNLDSMISGHFANTSILQFSGTYLI